MGCLCSILRSCKEDPAQPPTHLKLKEHTESAKTVEYGGQINHGLSEPELETEIGAGKRTTKQITWNVKPPPKNVKHIHELIMDEITSYFMGKGLQLIEDEDGTEVVTAINTEMVDVHREASNSSSAEATRVIMIRIQPTGDPNMKIKQINKGNILNLVFLAQNNKKLLECPHNKEQIVLLMEFFEVAVPSNLKEDIADMKQNMVIFQQARQGEREITNAGTKENDNQITCNVKSPPSIGNLMHCEIIAKITSTVKGNGYDLKTDGEGPTIPTIVTVVQSTTNVEFDIRRDTAAANLTGSESGNVIRLRIKPTLNQSENIPKRKDCLLDLVFLCDRRNAKLHDCKHNDEQCQIFMDYFLN